MSVSEKGKLQGKKPDWLKTPLPSGQTYFKIKRDLRHRKLVTVCEEAKCPNIGECWATNTATFMVLGDTCTRACRFCHVKTGNPQGWVDPEEPLQVAESCRQMSLDYVVLTMVDRDDLADGGATHLSQVIAKIAELNPGIRIEVLAGDFGSSEQSLQTLLKQKIAVFAHNIETIERLTPRVRDARAGYHSSLQVLRRVKEFSKKPIYTKSALMLGLGEEFSEIEQALKDLRSHDVDFVTIGQYMRPTRKHLSVKAWIEPSVFDELKTLAQDLGFSGVASAPLVRSSYRAREFYDKATSKR